MEAKSDTIQAEMFGGENEEVKYTGPELTPELVK